MQVHHLNCATMCPPAPQWLLNPQGKMVCHCLLVETNSGLVLIDTGLGTADVHDPTARLGLAFGTLARPRLLESETALAQVKRLGWSAEDVRHIIVTHLDLDHAGGLADFPHAQVHCFAPELDAATQRRTLLERHRYRKVHWAHGPAWVSYELEGERWFDFECVRSLEGLGDDILLVPLTGHSRGHCAVGVRSGEGWLLHCGDAYFFEGEMDLVHPRCTRALALFQRTVAFDHRQHVHNQQRLRQFASEQREHVRLFCAHDPAEFARLAQPKH